jgi:hypothetical protein
MSISTNSAFIISYFENPFWHINFWGILGTISGLLGIMLGWVSFKYNKPKIEIEEAILTIPNWVKRDWVGRPISQLTNNVLEFELDVVVRNERGGSGSISKPQLKLYFPAKNKFILLKNYKSILIKPITEHVEYEKESESVTKFWTERHGRAFNLTGGEKIDERLTYRVSRNPQLISDYVKNIDVIKYSLEYTNNFGKTIEKRISRLMNYEDVRAN